jgi:hypothetical protein
MYADLAGMCARDGVASDHSGRIGACPFEAAQASRTRGFHLVTKACMCVNFQLCASS